MEKPVDLLLVTVKAPVLAEALERVAAAPALVLPLLNGLEHMDVLRRRFADGRAATIGRLEAYGGRPARIVQQRRPLVTVAEDASPSALERAGIEVRLGRQREDVLWEKLARQGPRRLTSPAGARASCGPIRACAPRRRGVRRRRRRRRLDDLRRAMGDHRVLAGLG